LGTGGAGAGWLQVPAVGGAGRGGGTDRRARLGVRVAAGGPSCATGVGAGSGQAHTWGWTAGRWRGQVRHRGPDGRVAARSGGQPGGGEVGRMTGR
jgi:hypothetical protein